MSYARPEYRFARGLLAGLAAAGLIAFEAAAAPSGSVPAAASGSMGDALSAGLRHILPGGHAVILFLLALFLASPRMGKLIGQVLAYAAGHSLTLWLVATGVIIPPADLVGWLVPASLMIVALENLLFGRVTRIKYFLVFVFGLIHGTDFGLYYEAVSGPQGGGTGALIGFNLGLEIAIAAVLGLALAASLYFRGVLKQASRMDLYRPMIVVPISLAIAVAGLLWTVQAL